MSKLVLVDSQIIIWGIKGQASVQQQDKIHAAKMFVSWLSDNDYKLILPVPQLVELLSYVLPEQQSEIRKLFDRRFMIAPFDELAAAKCAELIYLSLNTSDLVAYRRQQAVPKNKIKFDCMLASIAITRGALKIYSEDNDLQKFANGQIDVCGMPTLIQQSDMFGNLLPPTLVE
jgi:predicted nucleic acid-binding protein